jgi:hypothetical protein
LWKKYDSTVPLIPFHQLLDNSEQSIKTSEVNGSYGVMDVVIAATSQLFSAQVSEKERQ